MQSWRDARTESAHRRLLGDVVHHTKEHRDAVPKESAGLGRRTIRSVAGIAMMASGLLWPALSGTPGGMILAAAGVGALVTGFVGFCPACAMIGRKLPLPDRSWPAFDP